MSRYVLALTKGSISVSKATYEAWIEPENVSVSIKIVALRQLLSRDMKGFVIELVGCVSNDSRWRLGLLHSVIGKQVEDVKFLNPKHDNFCFTQTLIFFALMLPW